jgi:hypothetical protein
MSGRPDSGMIRTMHATNLGKRSVDSGSCEELQGDSVWVAERDA